MVVSFACGGLPKEKLRLGHYISTTVILLTSAFGIYWCMTATGLDPLWSFHFAKKWCARSEWVHLNTTIFSALIRDACSIMGKHAGFIQGLYIPGFTIISSNRDATTCSLRHAAKIEDKNYKLKYFLSWLKVLYSQ